MPDSTFRALVVEETGDSQFSRQIADKSFSDLPKGDVLIKVHFSSLNYKDALSASGNKGVTRNDHGYPAYDLGKAGWAVETGASRFSLFRGFAGGTE